MLEFNFSPFPVLETERLLLRRIAASDAEAVMDMRSRENVMAYIDRERIIQLEQAAALIQVMSDGIDKNESIAWAIELKEHPGKLIGTIGYWRIQPQHHRAEIGYMLHPDHWRKGIMKEALFKVIDHGFDEMKLHSIEARINPANEASAAVLNSTGFVREAYFKEDYFFQGKFLDTGVYSLLRQK